MMKTLFLFVKSLFLFIKSLFSIMFMNTKKVILVGNASSGKTFTCNKLSSLSFKSTIGVEVHTFNSSKNCYKLWDYGSKEGLSSLTDSYYIQANIALIFHGGHNFLEPREWEKMVLSKVPKCQIYHIVGKLEEKYAQVLEILS
jgi:hypothetical protein